MAQPIRLVLALHNHQPVGNFDAVFEQAFQDSYRPFLDVWENYSNIPIALHTSGSLFEWLLEHHPEYIDRLAALVEAGRLEIIGGANYEPILAMLPQRDRVGQIRSYTELLESRLGAKIRGMWMPERIWEAGFVRDLAEAGIEYTILDDYHFKQAGLNEAQLNGYYISEDQGKILKIFPGSEKLRYTVPFADPQETIDYLAKISEEHPNSVIAFGDDGEKFGTWPDTKKHVYEDGWLARFLDTLSANERWLKVVTPSEAIDNVPPVGKVYLPDCSYREMTEWSLPVERQIEHDAVVHDLEHDPRWPQIRKFIRGGFWRNFKVKYSETDEMYTRMLMISNRLHELEQSTQEPEALEQAKLDLYRGQCNCPYWHGAFGGLYLPHLRGAIYRHLIQADNVLEKITHAGEQWVEIKAEDYNLDARMETMLANDQLHALVAPARGGILYELDVRAIGLNLLATLCRRPEAYHQKVLGGPQTDGEQVKSIHDRVVFKQEGLDQKVTYDTYPRKSLVDHFYDNEVQAHQLANGSAMERGDFAGGVYEAVMRRSNTRVQAQLTKRGNAWGHPLTIRKTITLQAGSSNLQIQYELEDLPTDHPFHFAAEFNFAGLPPGADDRFFHDGNGRRFGHLGNTLDEGQLNNLHLTDEWQGIDVGLEFSQPTNLWAFPIETVSQSEGGFELVHQSVSVQPHWLVQGDEHGKWSISIQLKIDTSLAESRQPQSELAATGS